MKRDGKFWNAYKARLVAVIVGILGLFSATLGSAIAQSAPSAAINASGATQTSTTVFFDFDTADLNEEARELISMSVMEAGGTNGISAHVAGHSSTAHSNPGTAEARQYNFELSLSRAEAVKAELLRLGVSENVITVEGVGSREPLVDTGPGVIEPMNRRAEIVLTEP